MNTILIPTDFSEAAKNAAIYAVEFFGAKAHYILLNVDDSEYRKSFRDIHDEIMESSKRYLEELKEEIEEEHGSLNITLQVHLGDIEANILDEARTAGADSIVMGNVGKSALEQVFLGSTAASIVKEADIPVLVVPIGVAHSDISRAVFAADYRHINNRLRLNPLLTLCDEYDLELMVLNVVDPSENLSKEEILEALKLENAFKGVNHEFYSVESSDIVTSISEFVEENEADLLVMLSREHSFFHKLTHRSVTKKATIHSKIPILVLHDDGGK